MSYILGPVGGIDRELCFRAHCGLSAMPRVGHLVLAAKSAFILLYVTGLYSCYQGILTVVRFLLTSSRHLLLTVFRDSGGRGGIGIGSLCIIGLFPGYFSWCTCEREHVGVLCDRVGWVAGCVSVCVLFPGLLIFRSLDFWNHSLLQDYDIFCTISCHFYLTMQYVSMTTIRSYNHYFSRHVLSLLSVPRYLCYIRYASDLIQSILVLFGTT